MSKPSVTATQRLERCMYTYELLPMGTPTQVFSVKLPQQLIAEIRRIADQEDRSAGSVIRQAARQYVAVRNVGEERNGDS